jgi:hypothetical protein
MIRLIDLYRVVGRRLTQKLIVAGWLVPIRSGSRGVVFEPANVHAALSRLARGEDALAPRLAPTTNGSEPERRKILALEEISLSEDELARL